MAFSTTVRETKIRRSTFPPPHHPLSRRDAVYFCSGVYILGELKFFIPYKAVLFHEYGNAILIYLTTLFLNLFAAAFALNRKFFLKDTGRKLSHLDKQLHVGQTEVRAPSLEEEVD